MKFFLLMVLFALSLQGQTKMQTQWDDSCKAQEAFHLNLAEPYRPLFLSGHKPVKKGEKVVVLAEYIFAETKTVEGYLWVLLAPGEKIVKRWDKEGNEYARMLSCGNHIRNFASISPIPSPSTPPQSLAFKPKAEKKIVVNINTVNNYYPPTTSPAPKPEEKSTTPEETQFDWALWGGLAVAAVGTAIVLSILRPQEKGGRLSEGGALNASRPVWKSPDFQIGVRAPI
ncbi:MAG: hypothetical protein K9L98_00260 [Candidatus Pacebacteria bacterium]|nr:hypothetical protein [Candidatus Paceibacterota bacterium]MCF7862436.1 hypothetical protein [Candidatus Paceibacterota bacterium]